MKSARDMKKYYDNGLWASGICFIQMLRTLCIKQIQRTRQRFQKICLVWRKENEDLTKGCTSKGNKVRHGSKVASFLLLYHLVKGFAIASITRNLVVSYWLNLQKSIFLRFSKAAVTPQRMCLFKMVIQVKTLKLLKLLQTRLVLQNLV